MKLTQLSYVATIAEQGSLRAAARHLGVAQPAFSRSIAALERELGAPLFERRARGMIATPLGEAFVRRVNAILNDVRRAKDEFEQLKGNALGEITIGLSIAAHLRLLPGSLKPFRDRHPKVRLHVIEGFYPTLAPGLQDGSVDFYIGPDPGLRLPAALKKETLFSGERAVLCRVKHPLANAASLRHLRDAEWITTSITPKAEHEIGDVFKRHRLPEQFRFAGDGAGAMGEVANRQSIVAYHCGQGRAIGGIDHRRNPPRCAARAGRQLSSRPYEKDRRAFCERYGEQKPRRLSLSRRRHIHRCRRPALPQAPGKPNNAECQ